MVNRIKYNFDDFTHHHYAELLVLAKLKGKFVAYPDFKGSSDEILWRHDVDFSLEESLNLAIIEAEFDVQSTYFILLHGEYYSPFEKESAFIIKKILDLGHNLGLHFDTHYYDIDNADALENKLLLEQRLMEDLFGTSISVFSFHNTTEFTMSCQDWQYGNMINTYAEYFQKNVPYCSDSNGYWRFIRLCDFVNQNKNLPIQVLTHPVWWTKNVMSPKQKIVALTQRRADKNVELYDSTLMKYNRVNIDW